MKKEITTDEIERFLAFRRGDQVHARDESGTQWRGNVEVPATAYGVLWIRTDQGERKLLDIQEHNLAD